jgi:DNA topoisomerase I
MNLIIVESPTKARTLSRFLGRDFSVVATVGHIMDLPKSQLAVDIDKGFKPDYQITPGKQKTISQVKKASQSADKIYLATDPDREGEAIAAHVAEILQQTKKLKNNKTEKLHLAEAAGGRQENKLQRIVFHEITKTAVEEALAHPRKVDVNLVDAQAARRVLDRIVGYELSPLLWEKLRYGLSAGRVQSPALRILMERERLIRAFVAEVYFVITGLFSAKGVKFPLVCEEETRNEKEADRIVSEAKNGKWSVVSVKEKEVKRNPYPPFITSTLQRSASTRLGFSPSRTMKSAQRLYEAGHITYMRTDSTAMSTQAQDAIISLIKKEYGEKYVQKRFFKTKSKNAQEAHECIRPTDVNFKFQISNFKLSNDEQRLYKLIWVRAVTSQMAHAVVKNTKISANITERSIPNFSSTGTRIVFDGWLAVDTPSRKEDVEVPALSEGESISLIDIEKEEKETQPPNRYTEAGLIKELEARGIGRPSTYASIMRTLENRGYTTKQGQTLYPTDTGDVVSTFLEQYFSNYISDTFTAEMENELDEIARGEREYEQVMREFYNPFHKDILKNKNIPKLTNLGPADAKYKCPVCGKKMIVKLGKSGKFLSCTNYPECKGALSVEGAEMGVSKVVGNHPDTNEAISMREGRFGPYLQIGEKSDENPKPRRASLPKGLSFEDLTMEKAVHLLSLPRVLGEHPETGEEVIANIGRYGPYIGKGKEFRSIRGTDTPYTITLKRALEILSTPKALPKGVELVKVLGKHPKTNKEIRLLKSKTGLFVQKGLRRFYFDQKDVEKITLEDAVEMMK